MKPDSPRLSAVVACYRDEEAIPQMHRRLVETFGRLQVDYEVIFVNDGSPDHSAEVLHRLAEDDSRVRVVTHSRNFGSQSAFTSGMRIASGDAVILLDGDLQDPPELIEEFYVRWREGFAVVYGRRVKREGGLLLRAAYKAFYRVFQAVAYVPVPLDAGDFSLLDRRVVDALNRLPENNRFLRGLRAWVGFRQTGVPYVRPQRPFGRSTNSLIRNLGWARQAIFSFSYLPLRLINLLALAAMLASLLGAVAEIAVRLLRPAAVPSGLTTVIVIVLFLGGIQLLCLGIIGSYLEHIYDEVKRRPPFIVDSIRGGGGDPPHPTSPTRGEVIEEMSVR